MGRSLGKLDIDLTQWTTDEIEHLARAVVDRLACARRDVQGRFHVALTEDEAQFIGKSMVLQVAIGRMVPTKPPTVDGPPDMGGADG